MSNTIIWPALTANQNLNISGIILIGAHHGGEIETFKNAGIQNIVLFEPHPENYCHLLQTVSRVQAGIPINKALGSKNQIVDMYCETANHGQSNSLLKPQVCSEIWPWIEFNKKTPVVVSTLDAELKNLPIEITKTLNTIIMDVQGFELEVLKGSNETLHSIDQIMTEINFRHIYENCALVHQLDNFLSNYGFARVQMDCSEDTPYGQGNALYRKTS